MDLSRTIAQSRGLYNKLFSTSYCCYKTFCSSNIDEKNSPARANTPSGYFDAYKQVYEHSGLFQNPGAIRAQQLAHDFLNIKKQDFKAATELSEKTAEITDENAAAKEYYDMYHKIFSRPDLESNLESESSEGNYYEEYRKLFQQPERFLSDKKPTETLTHTNEEGHLKMVDVGSKPASQRFAKASGKIYLGQKTFSLVQENKLKKGDVLNTAKIAGIMACKNTSSLIPLCHPLAISNMDMEVTLNVEECSVCIECGVHTMGKTGVEMEALTGVSVAALTVYDMCKAVSHEIVISEIQLLEKYGGVTGNYMKN